MHVEGLKKQYITKSDFDKNSLAFGSNPVVKTVGRQVTDKAFKILGAASVAITAATIAMSKKGKVENVSQTANDSFWISNIASDEDLAKIHKIDLEAFSKKYDVYSNFEEYKKELKDEEITTYVMKSKQGDVVGYYQLEPIEDGELYISSMAVEKDLRGTRSSVSVLSQIINEIIQIAKEQNVESIALDVDSENKSLVKLYKKFGFEIFDTVSEPSPNGVRTDYCMRIDFKKFLDDFEENLDSESTDYNKMSDEQIAKIVKMIKENPIYQDKMYGAVINRNSIPLLLKLIKNPEFLDSHLTSSCLSFVISDSVVSETTSKAKQALIDKFLTDEKYKKLPANLQTYILCNINYVFQLDVLDRILADEEISNDDKKTGLMFQALSHVSTNSRAEVFTRILDDEKLKKNKNITSNIYGIIHCIKEDFDPDLIIKCLNNEKLVSSNKNFEVFLKLMSSILTQENAEFIVNIIMDERLVNFNYLAERGSFFAWCLMDEEGKEAKKNFIERYLSDEKYYKNEDLKNVILPIIENIHMESDISANFYMIDNIFSDERLCKNESVLKDLSLIISGIKKVGIANYKIKAMQQVFSDERIASNKSVIKNLGNIILNVNCEDEYDAISQLIQTVLSDENILNHPALDKSLGFILATSRGFVYSNEQIKTLLELLNVAFENKHVLKTVGEDISDDRIAEEFSTFLAPIHRVKELIGEKSLIQALNMKLAGFKSFIALTHTLKRFAGDNYDKLLAKLNPEATAKYNSLSKTIIELKKKYPEVKAMGDNEELKKLQNEIATCTKEMQELRKSKVKLDPQQVINKVRVLAVIGAIEPKDMEQFIDLIQDGTKENEAVWKEKVNEYIFKKLDIKYDENLSKRLDLVSSKYLAEILLADRDFVRGFKNIIELIKAYPEKSNEEIFDMLSQNIKTKEMFETLGIDYEKWSKADKNSFIKVKVQLTAEEARKAAIEALEKEFNHPIFLELPIEETDKIVEALKKVGIEVREVQTQTWDENGFGVGLQNTIKLYKDGMPIKFEDLNLIMKTIKKEINSNEFWTVSTGNQKLDSQKSTIYTHFMKDRIQQYYTARDLKEDSLVELEIRKTDMNNISHALFLGNHGACCTAVGTGSNQYSAPTYVMNKMVSAIEIVDAGNFVGNTMCYIAIVDATPSLILDNIELKADYHNNDSIKKALIEYAKKLCAEIGKPDMPIYAGPYRHKLKMEDFDFNEHKMQIIGSSGTDEIYLDFITSGRVVNGNRVDNVKLFKIR